MNLVDSCGWLEYLADGPNAGFFARPLRDTGKLVVPTICLLEVFKRTLQQRGEEAALEVAGLMQQGTVVDLDAAIALDAADLSLEKKLSLASAVILATARAREATVWTQDAHFEHLAGVRYRPARPAQRK
jgi:predicted nucleic acid-binding protein